MRGKVFCGKRIFFELFDISLGIHNMSRSTVALLGGGVIFRHFFMDPKGVAF